ncbi:MAG TPA: HipA domain-containing protein [Devosia sp.]|nr:HipA domain-containing protein [Devosia sp.]
MPHRKLDVWLDGYSEPVGHLEGTDKGDVHFSYRPAYLERDDRIALSMSMPLRNASFDDPTSRFFFENLLQERDTARSQTVAKYRLQNDDLLGILEHLGKDCTGAVSALPAGAPPVKTPGMLGRDYRPLSDGELEALVLAIAEHRPLPKGRADPSPLAGVQSKVALTRLPNGQFSEPRPGSGAPTTHIIKVFDRRHGNDAQLEKSTLELSRELGMPTTVASVEKIGDLEVLLLERFDRIVDADGRVSRRHQEDFCQALGLSPHQKYERNGTGDHRFRVAAIAGLLDRTGNPVIERQRFMGATVFDLLVGNVDGHAKNFSLFHLPGDVIETTPRYDLVPTRLDINLTDELAYRIGDATTLDSISPNDFASFLAQLGIANKAAQRRLTERIVLQVAQGLAARLHGLGARHKKYADLIAHNMRILLPSLGIPVPPEAAGRDPFHHHGGGWVSS